MPTPQASLPTVPQVGQATVKVPVVVIVPPDKPLPVATEVTVPVLLVNPDGLVFGYPAVLWVVELGKVIPVDVIDVGI